MKKYDFTLFKKFKGAVIASSIVTIIPIIAGLLFWNKLPDSMPVHWGVDGTADGFGYKGLVIFLVPAIMLLLHWICISYMLADPGNRNQDRAVFRMVIWLVPLISLVVNGALYTTAFGREMDLAVYLPAFLAAMFIFMGNAIPKARRNSYFGVKLPWTLRSDENWNKTHRFTGKVWVAGGVLILLSMLFPEGIIIVTSMVVITLMVLIPGVYSYVYYRKQLKEGTCEKISIGKMGVFGLLFCVIVLVAVIVLLFVGDIKVKTNEESFTIEASFWEDITVDYDEVESIEYREELEKGERINGWGSARLGLGYFRSYDIGGNYLCYRYAYTDSAVVLTNSEDEVLVISCKDDTATKALYEELAAKINK